MMKRLKSYIIVLAAVCFAVSVSGCGKEEPDPNSGLYEAVSAAGMGMELSISDLYEQGVSFDLKDGGKAVVNLDGQEFKIKWSHDGDVFHAEGGGAEFDGTIGNGELNLVDVMGMGIDIKLVCNNLPNAGGSLLGRLRAAKDGENVYGPGADESEDWSEGLGDIIDGENDTVDPGAGEEEATGAATEYSIQNGLDDSFFGDGVVDADTLAEFYYWWGELSMDEKEEYDKDFQGLLVEKFGTKPIDTSEEFEEGLCHTEYVTPEGDGSLLILWKKGDDGNWSYASLSPGGTVFDKVKELEGE